MKEEDMREDLKKEDYRQLIDGIGKATSITQLCDMRSEADRLFEAGTISKNGYIIGMMIIDDRLDAFIQEEAEHA